MRRCSYVPPADAAVRVGLPYEEAIHGLPGEAQAR